MKLDRGKTLSITKLVYLVLFFLIAIVLFGSLNEFKSSLVLLKSSNKFIDLTIIWVSLSTFVLAALSIMRLSFAKLNFSRSLTVQFAANTVNRLLPAGVGALGIIYDYLLKMKNSKTQGIAILTVNNALGAISASILFMLLLFFYPHKTILHFNAKELRYIVIILILLLILLVVFYFSKNLSKIRDFILKTISDLSDYRTRKKDLFYAVLLQFGLNILNILALYLAVLALHLSVGVVVIAISYNFAVLFGSVIPAPGGVGSLDAGLVGALIFFGNPSKEALAITILFRILNMWLPFFIGIPALFYSRSRNLI